VAVRQRPHCGERIARHAEVTARVAAATGEDGADGGRGARGPDAVHDLVQRAVAAHGNHERCARRRSLARQALTITRAACLGVLGRQCGGHHVAQAAPDPRGAATARGGIDDDDRARHSNSEICAAAAAAAARARAVRAFAALVTGLRDFWAGGAGLGSFQPF